MYHSKTFIIISLGLLLLPISADCDQNRIGVQLGYFMPDEELHQDIYQQGYFSGGFFYERIFNNYFLLNLDAGFSRQDGKALAKSGVTDIETKLTLVPLTATMQYSLELAPLVQIYLGAGLDFWYYRETSDLGTYDAKDDDYGMSGYHGELGLRLFTADQRYFKQFGVFLQSTYSQIDNFGQNKLNLGGWTFNIGAFRNF